MRNKYFNDRTGKYGPKFDLQRKIHHEQICKVTDDMMKQKEIKVVQKGPREIFLEEFNKNGYEAAKNLLDSKYGKVFNNEMLINWLGIGNARQILYNKYSKEGIQEAYKTAELINEKIGFKVFENEDVDKILKQELEKENESR